MSVLIASVGFGLVTASILALAAAGFTLQFSATNVFNLAYGEVMTGSAFVAYEVTRAGLGLPLALASGGLFGAAFSWLLNRAVYAPFIRRGTKLFAMIIVTIAMSVILQNSLQALYGTGFESLAIRSGASIRFGPMIFTATQLAIIGLAVVTMLILHGLLTYTRTGKVIRATSTNPELARVSGVATGRVVDLVWLVSGAMCGLAGVALVINVPSFDSNVGGQFVIPVIAAAILGGIGQPYGAMMGAVVIGVATEVSAAYINPEYKNVVAFAILIIMLLVRSRGLLSDVATQKEVVA